MCLAGLREREQKTSVSATGVPTTMWNGHWSLSIPPFWVRMFQMSEASFTLQAEPSRAEPSRAEPDRTELNRAKRVTIPIASRADPNWKHCSWHFWTARMSNQVHVFLLTDNIWWRSLLCVCTRKIRFWVHQHFNPRKLDLLRNRIGRRLASKNKLQPGNTLCQARSGSVRRAVWMLPFHNVGLFSKPNRFGSARLGSSRLGWQCKWGLRLLYYSCR